MITWNENERIEFWYSREVPNNSMVLIYLKVVHNIEVLGNQQVGTSCFNIWVY